MTYMIGVTSGGVGVGECDLCAKLRHVGVEQVYYTICMRCQNYHSPRIGVRIGDGGVGVRSGDGMIGRIDISRHLKPSSEPSFWVNRQPTARNFTKKPPVNFIKKISTEHWGCT